MKRHVLKILITFIILSLGIASVVFFSIYVAPGRLVIKHSTIESKAIPKDLNEVNVAFMSDIHYGEFMDYDRFKSMIDKVNQSSPDIILFGGDLFSDPTVMAQNPEEAAKVNELLTNLKAPLGKFYVLGEDDLKSPDTKTYIDTFLYNAGFENLTNKSVKIHNGTSAYFTLIGLDSQLGGSPDIQSAFTNISPDAFTVVFTHVPDTLANIPQNSADLAFAGHSHGGQISLPLIGSLSSSDGTTKYESGTYHENKLIIAISNGMGTTDVDMRVFSVADILIYRLESKK